ncbi:putative replication protein (plasmid) [Staphylococcus pseudintermedius]|nr:putative replication protein [Staphylococcus pseudintermedius]
MFIKTNFTTEILKTKWDHNVKKCGNVLEFKTTEDEYLKLYET